MELLLSIMTILTLQYMRPEVCEAEKPYNHPIEISMPDTASVADLVQCLIDYKEPNYQALPPAGGTWWQLSYDGGTLALICKDPLQVTYANVDKQTLLKDLGITRICAFPAEQPTEFF